MNVRSITARYTLKFFFDGFVFSLFESDIVNLHAGLGVYLVITNYSALQKSPSAHLFLNNLLFDLLDRLQIFPVDLLSLYLLP